MKEKRRLRKVAWVKGFPGRKGGGDDKADKHVPSHKKSCGNRRKRNGRN